MESRIEHVTVYARGARVRRVATVADGDAARARFVGLPVGLIDDSVRAEVVTGAAIAAQVRVSLEVPEAAAAADDEPADVVAARRRVGEADAELARLDAALGALTHAAIVGVDPTDDAPVAWADVVAARRALVDLRAARDLELRRAQIAARDEAAAARRALVVLAEREARATTDRAARAHEPRKVVELELVRGAAGDGASELRIAIEYRVAAARWAPSYVARLDGDAARVEIRAAVAQRTGEDWLGAALRLSTAEPEQFAPLPELAPQRIGRRQDAPRRGGFRAPPAGVESLFVDYDRGAGPAAPPAGGAAAPARGDADDLSITQPMATPKRAITAVVWDEESSRAKDAFHTPPYGTAMPSDGAVGGGRGGGGMPPPAPGAPPMAQSIARPAPSRSSPPRATAMSAPAAPGGAPHTVRRSGAPATPPSEDTVENVPTSTPGQLVPRLDYGSLRMSPAAALDRGRLVAAGASAHELATMVAVDGDVDRVIAMPLPAGCHAAWAHSYDYAFAADGRVDVPSDGGWHALAITAKPSTVKLRHVAVPREQADVFRMASIPNPHDAPLLPGPIDVYDRGTFLATSEVELTPPGAVVDIGLGVDPAVKIARNSEFHEETSGMLRGALKLMHSVAIDVDNRSPRAIDLEVRERVPVARDGDDAVEIAVGRAEPAWEAWAPDPDAPADTRMRGGKRWRVQVAAGARTTLRASYEVKLSSKLELVGGNRRES
nr:DUF4139 domain-containing protein [Kofleriaceae bacterium]